MIARILIVLVALVFAVGILSISVLQSTSPKYAFTAPTPPQNNLQDDQFVEINYPLAFPGPIAPDHPLWPAKAARDRLWLVVTKDLLKKAEVYLLLADKRLAAAIELFNRDKLEQAVTTASKAEKYLELAVTQEQIARQAGSDTNLFLQTLSVATQKHRLELEKLLSRSPEDAAPVIIEIIDYPKSLFSSVKKSLENQGLTPYEYTF